MTLSKKNEEEFVIPWFTFTSYTYTGVAIDTINFRAPDNFYLGTMEKGEKFSATLQS